MSKRRNQEKRAKRKIEKAAAKLTTEQLAEIVAGYVKQEKVKGTK